MAFTLLATLAVCGDVHGQQSNERGTYEQRALYKRALDDLTKGRKSDYQEARAALADYVLLPYLDYYELQSRLSTASAADVQQFRNQHDALPVANILFRRWLKRLGKRRDWKKLLANYEDTTDIELQCYYLRARLANGERAEAYALVEPLWTVAKSQPDACDPLFEAWIAAGQLTESMVWRRLELALAANQRTLARYLQRFLTGSRATWAKALYDAHVNPQLITRTNRYKDEDDLVRKVIVHGIRRLAAKDAQDAQKAWGRYQRRHDFSIEQIQSVADVLLPALALEGSFPATEPESLTPELAEAMAVAAISQQRWTDAITWIERLPADILHDERWQYWLARSLSSAYLGSERARLTYRALALKRNYYGFLAAETIGRAPQLNAANSSSQPVKLIQIRQRPGAARALELYAVNDMINARREWRRLLREIPQSEKVHAARLALQIGWTAQGIRTANNGNLRDNVELRFPLAYSDMFQRVSHVTDVPHSFLIAIARQESIFDPRARSSANARGLMQMLPTTASLVARRAALAAPSATDLYNPEVNTELGGHHLAWLLKRFHSSRPLVAAAYNAGEHRVDRWIKDKSGMPMDIWIETIPFRETRGYVKNVLAFSQVYGLLLESPLPMLGVQEASVP